MDLLTTLVLTSFVFTAGGYAFTFKYVQATARALWAGIEALRQDLRENDIKHLEERIKVLEDK